VQQHATPAGLFVPQVSVWEEQKKPVSSRFALSAEESTPLVGGGSGWDDDLDEPGLLELSGDVRRKAAEEKRQQRRLERGMGASAGNRKPAKLAATRTED
jgi:hypothetical protein